MSDAKIPLVAEPVGMREGLDQLGGSAIKLKDGALPFPPQGRVWLT